MKYVVDCYTLMAPDEHPENSYLVSSLDEALKTARNVLDSDIAGIFRVEVSKVLPEVRFSLNGRTILHGSDVLRYEDVIRYAYRREPGVGGNPTTTYKRDAGGREGILEPGCSIRICSRTVVNTAFTDNA